MEQPYDTVDKAAPEPIASFNETAKFVERHNGEDEHNLETPSKKERFSAYFEFNHNCVVIFKLTLSDKKLKCS